MSWTSYVWVVGLLASIQVLVQAARDEEEPHEVGRQSNAAPEEHMQISVNARSLQLSRGSHSSLAEIQSHAANDHLSASEDSSRSRDVEIPDARMAEQQSPAQDGRPAAVKNAEKMASAVMDVLSVRSAANEFMSTAALYKEWARKEHHTPESLEEGNRLKEHLEQSLHALQASDADLQKK